MLMCAPLTALASFHLVRSVGQGDVWTVSFANARCSFKWRGEIPDLCYLNSSYPLVLLAHWFRNLVVFERRPGVKYAA